MHGILPGVPFNPVIYQYILAPDKPLLMNVTLVTTVRDRYFQIILLYAHFQLIQSSIYFLKLRKETDQHLNVLLTLHFILRFLPVTCLPNSL